MGWSKIAGAAALAVSSVVFVGASPAQASLCHEPWEGHQVCIAVDECHVLGLQNPFQPGRPEPISEPPDVSCLAGPRG